MDKSSSRKGLPKILSPKPRAELVYPTFLKNKIRKIDFSLIDSPTASYPESQSWLEDKHDYGVSKSTLGKLDTRKLPP
jgi:hypothetical protein